MKVVVGLGNPGAEYADTPHNAGFATVDALSAQLDCRSRLSAKFNARIARTAFEGEPLLLVQPQTYMNNSGLTVASVLHYHKEVTDNLIVISDDADLPFGRLRVRARGGSGGHRGLESIIQHIGTQGFARVRIGIGRAEDGRDLVKHVLAPLTARELEQMAEVVDRAAQAVLCIVRSGAEQAMNRFNSDPAAPATEP